MRLSHRFMNPQINTIDFNERPFIAIWEVTQACDLACVHCRASAQPDRNPLELSTDEGKHLIDQIAALKVPVFVLTGGDPIKRPDLFELIGHARAVGVRVSLTPSATPLLTREIIVRLKEAGLARLAVSMDGAGAETHDAFRGMKGSFARTLDAVRWADEIGLPVQINTTFSRRNIGEIDSIVALMEKLKITMWSVFFLVPTGRGKLDDLLSADEFESVFAKIYSLSKTASFDIKTTEAQHYRRYILQQRVAERKLGMGSSSVHERSVDAIGRAPRGLNDGKGFVFISHKGEVFPSGFLPLSGGNIREQELATIYRDSPLFRGLRNTSKLEGKCGSCEFKEICGGSRARAHALTGNPYAEEPCCSYVPKGYRQPAPQMKTASTLHVLQCA
ncbi:MAG: TIGR04053 family radical SAM/SPASM domain-containing protein [Acidobacteriaceae bacterium]